MICFVILMRNILILTTFTVDLNYGTALIRGKLTIANDA